MNSDAAIGFVNFCESTEHAQNRAPIQVPEAEDAEAAESGDNTLAVPNVEPPKIIPYKPSGKASSAGRSGSKSGKDNKKKAKTAAAAICCPLCQLTPEELLDSTD